MGNNKRETEKRKKYDLMLEQQKKSEVIKDDIKEGAIIKIIELV